MLGGHPAERTPGLVGVGVGRAAGAGGPGAAIVRVEGRGGDLPVHQRRPLRRRPARPAAVLSLMVEDETVPVEALPPPVTGAELVRRAEEAAPGRRLTA